MLPKLLFVLLAFTGNFIIQWYGNFTGKLPGKGTYLGFSYDSVFVRAVVTQFEYLWVLVIINILFTMMFNIGFSTFKSFLPLAVVWLSMCPISALVFNAFVLKEKASAVAFIGLLLVIAGSVAVVAQKEISKFLMPNA